MPFDVGTPEILIILLIAIILLGPSKIPQLARSLGEAVREFRKASAEISAEPIQPARPVRAEQPIISAQAKKEEVDYETIRKLAEKLGVTTEGKSEDELIKEIISKAKEKGLLEEKQKKQQ
jgi:sec-independent protein translocase protein TatA